MKKVKLQLFGSFLLKNGEIELGEDGLHSKKLLRLLAYILVNRDSVLDHKKLIEVFWEGNTKSPESALKNLMYRLRSVLKALGDEQYICTLPGAYCWNPEIWVEADYEYFEKLATDFREMEPGDPAGSKRLCQEIIKSYHGNITERLAKESWIVSKVTWYRSVYMDTLKKLCEIYEGEENWIELEQVCNQALTIDSVDEDLHYYLIRALAGQKKYDLAMFHYEKVKKLFYENQGFRHLNKMHRAICEMMAETGADKADLNCILKELKEQKKTEGAFFCDYQMFCLIYEIEMKRMKRMGAAEYVLLLTVKRSGNVGRNPDVDDILMEGMEKLETILRKVLRTGDLAVRYSPTQYLLLLPVCSYETSVSVMVRVRKRFQEAIGAGSLKLVCEMEEFSA